MFTNNFKKVLAKCIFSSTQNELNAPELGSPLPTLITTDGEERQMKVSSVEATSTIMYGLVNMLNHMSTSGSNNTLYLKVGTGTTTPTGNDYELATVNTDISCDTVVAGVSANYTKTYTGTFSNPTSSDIVVTELGLYGNVWRGNYENPVYIDCLFDRTVLSTPITIPAGESKTITYELSF